ncbi:ribonuclease H-like domain-containing protein [Halosolutus amylolyticus]|uniref:Ribonuclease H-like domain-containing protein n=1 Tax=Halosolutus amylolyticus TaxID=2932267 RepID=A0ABD5PN45_9EURY|nr:ribonuclease H-like domain-containing protein [Halosolutus amylolyticus]
MTVEHDAGAAVLAVRCDALAGPAGGPPAAERLADVLTVFDPDLVAVVRDGMDVRTISRLRRAFDGPVFDPGGSASARSETVDGVTIGFASRLAALSDADPNGGTATEPEVPADADYVVCDDVETRADEVAMEATLEGRDVIARYQARSATETTFLTGSLPANYAHVWTATADGRDVRLPVRGLGPIRRSGAPELACLRCATDGAVSVSSVPADRFGLQALDGVGPTTARRLRDGGFDSRAAVADASPAALRSVRGVGDATARTMRASARALADGRVVRRSSEPVPPAEREPLFVDIETDGLSPTVIPLIGVYDPDRDAYVDFVDTEPSREEPGAATRAFLEWLAAEYDRPAIAAWNGYEFDYKHLDRFVNRYAPAFAEFWREDVRRCDPYDWAVRQDHAHLPGRTNRLEDVAGAIGCDRGAAAGAIDGATVARRLRRSIESPDSIAIDWEAIRRYCEADVQELAAVYDAIAAAEPAADESIDSPNGDEPTQTGLGDF